MSNEKYLSEKYKILLILFISLGIYYPSIFAQVNSLDDLRMIQDMLNIKEINIKNILFPESTIYYYRPLLNLTFIFDRLVWNCHESFMHMENVILHSINGIMVYYISSDLINKFRIKTSGMVPLFISLLFILHPINTEPVNWISGRTDVLAGTFVFVSFLIFLKKGITNVLWNIFASFVYFLGLLSKESALGLLPVIFYLMILKEVYIENIPLKNKIIAITPFFVITVIYFIFRLFPNNDTGIGMITNPKEYLDVFAIAGSSIKAFGFYIKKLLIPLPLNFGIIEINRGLYFLLGILSIFLTLYMAIRRKNAITFFFIFCIPFIIIAIPVAIYKMAWTPLAERYLYISSFGISAFIVLVINSIPFSLGKINFVLIAAILLLSGVVTGKRNIIWQSNLTLYEDTVKKSPNFAVARNEYGVALYNKGEHNKAYIEFQKAAELSKGSGFKLSKMNEILLAQKGNESLIASYSSMLGSVEEKQSKDIIKKIISFTEASIAQEKEMKKKNALYRELLSNYTKLHKIENNGFYLYKIGQIYIALGDKTKAVEYFQKSFIESPNEYFSEPARKLAKDLKNEINNK